MNFAYGWAFSKPVGKVFHNLTITGLSAAVALVIGTIELAGLIASCMGVARSGRDRSRRKRQATHPPSPSRVATDAGTAQPEAASRVGARRLSADR